MKSRRPMALSVKAMVVGLAVALGVLGVATGPTFSQFCDNNVVSGNCLRFNQSSGEIDGPSLCLGSGGRDVIIAIDDEEDVTVSARGGADVIIGSDDENNGDDLCGDGGNDLIVGLAGNDDLFGGSGSDVLIDNGGNDLYNGGPGNDTCINADGDDQQISC